MSDQKHFAVSGLVIKDNRVLFVRHTYGPAKGKLIIPGGYVQENEMASDAIEREVLEETSVNAKVSSILAIRIKPDQWWIIYKMKYISGEAVSDGKENSEAIFIDADEALTMDDVGEVNKRFIREALSAEPHFLEINDWLPGRADVSKYKLYMGEDI